MKLIILILFFSSKQYLRKTTLSQLKQSFYTILYQYNNMNM